VPNNRTELPQNQAFSTANRAIFSPKGHEQDETKKHCRKKASGHLSGESRSQQTSVRARSWCGQQTSDIRPQDQVGAFGVENRLLCLLFRHSKNIDSCPTRPPWARKMNSKMYISETVQQESFVRITYITPENELTTKQKVARERFENTINQAMENFHEETSDGLIQIELYPCDCRKCRVA
jgi:hypothetical protein